MLSEEELSIFELAFNLRLPYDYVANEMSYEEFVGWEAYFEKRPIGWREDLRTFYNMKSNGLESKPDTIFPSLAVIMNNTPKSTPVSSLKSSALFGKLCNAVGGVKVNANGEFEN
jgi:hypothetical protein